MKKFDITGYTNSDNYCLLFIIKNKTVAEYKTLSFINILCRVYWFSGNSEYMYSNTYAISNSSVNDIGIAISMIDHMSSDEYDNKMLAFCLNSDNDIEVYIKRNKSCFNYFCAEISTTDDSCFLYQSYPTFNIDKSSLNNPQYADAPNLYNVKNKFYKSNDNGQFGWIRSDNILTVYGKEIKANSTEKNLFNVGAENSPTIDLYHIGRGLKIGDNTDELLKIHINTKGDVLVKSRTDIAYGCFTMTYII